MTIAKQIIEAYENITPTSIEPEVTAISTEAKIVLKDGRKGVVMKATTGEDSIRVALEGGGGNEVVKRSDIASIIPAAGSTGGKKGEAESNKDDKELPDDSDSEGD